MRRKHAALAVVAAGALALSACGSASSLEGSAPSGEALTIGSQDYYSNEIIAEAYAQALEGAGFAVNRQMRIGQREVYMPEVAKGTIDVFPEYTGNLLQYLKADATETTSEDAYRALAEAMPEGLRALDQAGATDQDSYVVSEEFAQLHSLTSIGDLAGAGTVVLGGNSELETRPYGPEGLASVYGVTATFTPIEDSGGRLAAKALRDGTVQVADIYSSNPVLAEGGLRVLQDPEGLFLASHVVPIVSSKVDERAAAVINSVSAALTPEALIEMNRQSTAEQKSAADIARAWLAAQGLAG